MSDSNEKITEETLRVRLAAKVRKLRTKAGLTLKVTADRAEIHWRHLQKIEAAEVNVTLQTLVRLASSLGTEPAGLIGAV